MVVSVLALLLLNFLGVVAVPFQDDFTGVTGSDPNTTSWTALPASLATGKMKINNNQMCGSSNQGVLLNKFINPEQPFTVSFDVPSAAVGDKWSLLFMLNQTTLGGVLVFDTNQLNFQNAETQSLQPIGNFNPPQGSITVTITSGSAFSAGFDHHQFQFQITINQAPGGTIFTSPVSIFQQDFYLLGFFVASMCVDNWAVSDVDTRIDLTTPSSFGPQRVYVSYNQVSRTFLSHTYVSFEVATYVAPWSSFVPFIFRCNGTQIAQFSVDLSQFSGGGQYFGTLINTVGQCNGDFYYPGNFFYSPTIISTFTIQVLPPPQTPYPTQILIAQQGQPYPINVPISVSFYVSNPQGDPAENGTIEVRTVPGNVLIGTGTINPPLTSYQPLCSISLTFTTLGNTQIKASYLPGTVGNTPKIFAPSSQFFNFTTVNKIPYVVELFQFTSSDSPFRAQDPRKNFTVFITHSQLSFSLSNLQNSIDSSPNAPPMGYDVNVTVTDNGVQVYTVNITPPNSAFAFWTAPSPKGFHSVVITIQGVAYFADTILTLNYTSIDANDIKQSDLTIVVDAYYVVGGTYLATLDTYGWNPYQLWINRQFAFLARLSHPVYDLPDVGGPVSYTLDGLSGPDSVWGSLQAAELIPRQNWTSTTPPTHTYYANFSGYTFGDYFNPIGPVSGTTVFHIVANPPVACTDLIPNYQLGDGMVTIYQNQLTHMEALIVIPLQEPYNLSDPSVSVILKEDGVQVGVMYYGTGFGTGNFEMDFTPHNSGPHHYTATFIDTARGISVDCPAKDVYVQAQGTGGGGCGPGQNLCCNFYNGFGPTAPINQAVTFYVSVNVNNGFTFDITKMVLLVNGTVKAANFIIQNGASNYYNLQVTYLHTQGIGPFLLQAKYSDPPAADITCQNNNGNIVYFGQDCKNHKFPSAFNKPAVVHRQFDSNTCNISTVGQAKNTGYYPIGTCAAYSGYGAIISNSCNPSGNFTVQLYLDCTCTVKGPSYNSPVGCQPDNSQNISCGNTGPDICKQCVKNKHRARCPPELSSGNSDSTRCGEPLPNFKSPAPLNQKFDGPDNTVAVPEAPHTRPQRYATHTLLRMDHLCPATSALTAFKTEFSTAVVVPMGVAEARVQTVGCVPVSTNPPISNISFIVIPDVKVLLPGPFLAVAKLGFELDSPSLPSTSKWTIFAHKYNITGDNNRNLFEANQPNSLLYDLCGTSPLTWSHQQCPHPRNFGKIPTVQVVADPVGAITTLITSKFTVSVHPPAGSNIPLTGTVNVFDFDGTLLASGRMSASQNSFNFKKKFANAANHMITANYYGDNHYAYATFTLPKNVQSPCAPAPKPTDCADNDATKPKPLCCLNNPNNKHWQCVANSVTHC